MISRFTRFGIVENEGPKCFSDVITLMKREKPKKKVTSKISELSLNPEMRRFSNKVVPDPNSTLILPNLKFSEKVIGNKDLSDITSSYGES